jgi:bifunctional DNA-binding transcriptional regulator/antitoxin component of YhaV-PrlF toxin-antitoxin module
LVFTIESNEQGRLVIPAEVREALSVKGKTHWQREVRDGAISLKLATVIPREGEDAWA